LTELNEKKEVTDKVTGRKLIQTALWEKSEYLKNKGDITHFLIRGR